MAAIIPCRSCLDFPTFTTLWTHPVLKSSGYVIEASIFFIIQRRWGAQSSQLTKIDKHSPTTSPCGRTLYTFLDVLIELVECIRISNVLEVHI